MNEYSLIIILLILTWISSFLFPYFYSKPEKKMKQKLIQSLILIPTIPILFILSKYEPYNYTTFNIFIVNYLPRILVLYVILNSFYYLYKYIKHKKDSR